LDDAKYPVTAEQLKQSKVLVVADPFDLSRRAASIESKLSGDDRLALTVQPTALAEKLKAAPGVGEVELWDFPFRTIRDQLRSPRPARRQMVLEFLPYAWRPTLWKARVLHFQGHQKGDIDSLTADPDEVVNDHREALELYTKVRTPDRVLNEVASESKRQIYSTAKDEASYWVGLLLFDEGKLDSAEDWFSDPRLRAKPDGPWASGTQYNLGRTYEALGNNAEAIKLYEADKSPQRDGNRLRARLLKNKPSAEPAAPANEEASAADAASN
jgi:tetratricopeptide (TPR) repeat protein